MYGKRRAGCQDNKDPTRYWSYVIPPSCEASARQPSFYTRSSFHGTLFRICTVVVGSTMSHREENLTVYRGTRHERRSVSRAKRRRVSSSFRFWKTVAYEMNHPHIIIIATTTTTIVRTTRFNSKSCSSDSFRSIPLFHTVLWLVSMFSVNDRILFL